MLQLRRFLTAVQRVKELQKTRIEEQQQLLRSNAVVIGAGWPAARSLGVGWWINAVVVLRFLSVQTLPLFVPLL